MKRIAAHFARQYGAHCHREFSAWMEDERPDYEGMEDLWLARAEAMSSFVRWLEGER